MRVFITGIAGFLGSHLADALLSEGHEVRGVDNLVGGYADNVPPRAHFVRADCCELEPLRPLMAGVDVVFHCAATPHEGLSVFSPRLVVESVATATASVLSTACDARVQRFVFLSSMARYGTGTVPFEETQSPRPQDPYGIAKLAAEDLVKNLSGVHGMQWAIAVPHNIYGPRQKYDDPFRNVAAIFANLMLQGRQPFVYGDGLQERSFSFVHDVAAPLARMGDSHRVVGQVVNLGPDDEFVTVMDLGRKIAAIVGHDFRPTMLPGRPQEVRLAYCSSGKARRLLGYKPETSLADGLHLLVDWIRARGPKPFEYHLPVEIRSDKAPETWTKKLM